MKKRHRFVTILVIAGVVVVIGVLTLVNYLRQDTAAAAPPINVVTVANQDVAEILDVTGSVKSMEEKTFFSPVTATLDQVSFQMGDSVTSGEPLISFDIADLESQAEKANMSVQSGQYGISDAVSQGRKAQNTVADARNRVNVLQGEVDSLQRRMDDLNSQISRTNSDAQAKAEQEAKDAAAQLQTQVQGMQQAIAETWQQESVAQMTYLQAKAAWDNGMLDPANTPEILAQLADASNTAQVAWEGIQRQRQELESQLSALQGGAGLGSGSFQPPDTSGLQQDLAKASSDLAEKKADLASQRAIADSDAPGPSEDSLAQMRISNNLAEMDAKSVEDLIEEGRNGIQAEFNGVISASSVVPGMMVTQGMQLFTLQSTEEVNVEISASNNDYGKLQEGQKATIEVGGATYDGTVSFISRVAVPDVRGNPSISALIHFDKPDENVFLGVDAKVSITVAQASNVPVVPVEAVNVGRSGSFCYVLKDGVITQVSIETGVASTSYIQITDGISAGDQVILDIGSFNVGDRATAREQSQ